jgi:3-dehydroquinate dehydratase II
VPPEYGATLEVIDVVQILLLHGPNLSQLGARDPAQYGTATLAEVEDVARAAAEAEGATLTAVQTEHEGEMLERLHAARTDGTQAVIINAGAWSHYSIAVRDALEMLTIPKVEIHLSNLAAREPFRHTSVMTAVCDGAIVGLGVAGYPLAVRAAVTLHERGRA